MTILLVDDDPDEIFLFEEALRDIGANITLVTSNGGDTCLDVLNNLIPDFILLDINMPKMNGKDCLKAIRKNEDLAQVPIIMYSTTVSQTDAEFFREFGVDFIKKPSSFEDLVGFIKQLFLPERLQA